MARRQAFKLGRALPIFGAVLVGHFIGGWNPAALRTDGLSAADAIALRFPQEWSRVLPAASLAMATAPANPASDAQLALLSPQPMMPQSAVPQAAPQVTQDQAPQAPAQIASAADPGAAPAPDANELPQPLAPRTVPLPAKTVAAERHHVANRPVINRPGYMLDDAQIASIKERLNLTPDQEAMWPTVEAALRNIAYTHTRAPAAHSAQPDGPQPDGTQVAAVDPDSVEDLKSAATPLILSFSDEQKDEVRNIVHIMGLDQLASQF
jgi:hypothetical protein